MHGGTERVAGRFARLRETLRRSAVASPARFCRRTNSLACHPGNPRDWLVIYDTRLSVSRSDSHTKDNRDKRKVLQERRSTIAKGMQILQAEMQQGQQGLNGLHQSIEGSLQLAAYAQTWEWKEAVAVHCIILLYYVAFSISFSHRTL